MNDQINQWNFWGQSNLPIFERGLELPHMVRCLIDTVKNCCCSAFTSHAACSDVGV